MGCRESESILVSEVRRQGRDVAQICFGGDVEGKMHVDVAVSQGLVQWSLQEEAGVWGLEGALKGGIDGLLSIVDGREQGDTLVSDSSNRMDGGGT